ncbi:MAG: tRNA (guanosine(37)-N1)-methyltransferase TrmD [Patescibacteria group bacterium]|jgi:tRNA (guanine37-N1)-methyltransferase
MKFDIITLFPEMFVGPFSESILKKAQNKDLIKINFHNLRNWATDAHGTVDDTPYGGGAGMVLKIDVMDKALEAVKSDKAEGSKEKIILLSPKGRRLNQDIVRDLAQYDRLILLCGHYEEFDERIRENLVDDDISLGDFVLTGGEIPAMALVDSVSRLVPGVLKEGSPDEESFMQKDESDNFLLEYPQYTRPVEYKGWKVPEVLQSGNHGEIDKWRDQNRQKAE